MSYQTTKMYPKKYYLVAFILCSFCLQNCGGCSSKHPRKDKRSTKSELSRGSGVKAAKQDMNTVKMLQEGGGVYKIPVMVNGVQMKFIFDTGAGMISISTTEALFLYKQGTLTEDDYIGELNFRYANGDIRPGTVVRLRTVQIGNKTLENIDASIVDNEEAPLLLGQSALEKFGKISIDYSKGTITFDE